MIYTRVWYQQANNVLKFVASINVKEYFVYFKIKIFLKLIIQLKSNEYENQLLTTDWFTGVCECFFSANIG